MAINRVTEKHKFDQYKIIDTAIDLQHYARSLLFALRGCGGELREKAFYVQEYCVKLDKLISGSSIFEGVSLIDSKEGL